MASSCVLDARGPELNMAYTVRQLIETLRGFPEDMLVVTTSEYGDHWNTELAHGVGDIGIETIQFSDYHQEFALPEEIDDDEKKVKVLVLKRAESYELKDELEWEDED